MKKFAALFYKEFLETRWETLIFMLVGACYYFAAPRLFSPYPVGDVGSGRLRTFITAGIIAMWLNATILSATAFARERENGCMETLRRIAPRWNVAALAKFCYVLASTAFIAAIVYGVTLYLDEYHRLAFSTTLRSYFLSDGGIDLMTFVHGSGLGVAFCWGVFWTGRVDRQATAIFLTIVSALACAVVAIASYGILTVGKGEVANAEFVNGFCLVCGLLALAFSPVRNRFGYRDAPEGSILNESAKLSDDATDGAVFDAFKRRAAESSKPWTFPAIVAHVLREAALFFRSPASILFEFGFLIFLTAFVVSGAANSKWSEFFTGVVAPILYCVYLVSFASGLFLDAKRRGAPLKTRFGVGLWQYWLANALVAVGVALVGCLCARFFFVSTRLEVFDDYGFVSGLFVAKPEFWALAFALATLAVGAALWSAATPGGRLVVVAKTTLVVVATFVSAGLIFHNKFATPGAGTFFFVVGALFALASIPVVAKSLKERKDVPMTLVPPIALAATFLFPLLAPRLGVDLNPQGLPEKLPARAIFANLPSPANTAEYSLYQTSIRSMLDNYASAASSAEGRALHEKRRAEMGVYGLELFPQAYANTEPWLSINDAAKSVLLTIASTKMFAAGPKDEGTAEKSLYDRSMTALKEVGGPKSYLPFLEFLAELPQKRPTYDEFAANKYVYYGAKHPIVAPFTEKTTLEALRMKFPLSWNLALWNACQVEAESQRKTIDFRLNGPDADAVEANGGWASPALPYAFEIRGGKPKTVNLDLPPGRDATRITAYNTFLRALDGDYSRVPLEIQRRLLFLALAVREKGGPNALSFYYPESYGAIIADERFPDALGILTKGGKKAPDPSKGDYPEARLDEKIDEETRPSGLYPVITKQQDPAPTALRSTSALEPYLDADKNQLSTLDGRKAFFCQSTGKRARFSVTLPPRDVKETIRRVGPDGVPRPMNQPTVDEELLLLFSEDGTPLLDVSGAQYYGCRYNAVDSRGEPLFFMIAPCDEKPPFDCDDCELFTGYSKGGLPEIFPDFYEDGDKTYVARVRAARLFDRDGENVFIVKDLWLLFKPKTGGPTPPKNVFVDATGKEVLDKDGKPKYAQKSGVFLDRRHVSVPNYPYVFDLPEPIAKESEKLKIVFAPETGVYKEPKDGVFLVENGRVYSQIRAVGLAAGYSWFLDPTADRASEYDMRDYIRLQKDISSSAKRASTYGVDFPVLFVAPTQRDGWSAVPE